MQNYHLSPSRGHWNLTAEGGSRVLNVFPTRQDGIEACSKIIRSSHGLRCALMIHRSNGSIEEEHAYPASHPFV